MGGREAKAGSGGHAAGGEEETTGHTASEELIQPVSF